MTEEKFKELHWRYDRIYEIEKSINRLKKARYVVVTPEDDNSFVIDDECVSFIIKHYQEKLEMYKEEFAEM